MNRRIAIASAAGAALLAGTTATAVIITRRRRAATKAYNHTCDRCGVVLTPKTHHRLFSQSADETEELWAKSGAGTAMVADFCPEHCEGGCSHGCTRSE